MGLDIRHLRMEDPAEFEKPEVTTDAGEGAEPLEEGMEQLLQRAAGGVTPAEQAHAVDQLRQIIPSAEGIETLWTILDAADDPRRLIAVQMLGFHRQWLSSRSRLRQAVALARRERDPAVSRALVWCLRQRSEIAEFLQHECDGAAREAALGLPLNRQTLPHLLTALYNGCRATETTVDRLQVERVLLGKLRSIHPSLVRDVVDFLLEKGWEEGEERLLALFETLPQLPLFEIFLEGQQLPDWDPQQDENADRSRIWQQLVRAARQVMEGGPASDLVRHLLTRSGEDDAFARRHARFLPQILRQAKIEEGGELVSHLERLTFRASEDKVARLAQLLVELCQRLDGPAGTQAASLLEAWKGRSADLRLKIYHMQQSLAD